MPGANEDGMPASSDSLFSGVRFVLFGFDPVSVSQYRSELVRRGGVDVGRYDSSCTHVIVSGLTYDDPVCVAARKDGKILVTELWIEDCVDFSKLVDTSRVLYRPVKDPNGIPGSDSMHICLTGYQRPERDDIMKMVELMGAHFSKPLIATKITHLICYKHEGEKYELAKRVNIKLVNHRWLEDCLREWKILPTDNYTKSGWELEVMEAQAQDSEDELETGNANHLADNARLCVDSDIRSDTKVVDSAKLSNIHCNANVETAGDIVQMGSSSRLASDYSPAGSELRADANCNPGSLSNTEGKKLSSGSRLGLSSSKPVLEGSFSSFRKTPSKPVKLESSMMASPRGKPLQSKIDDIHESRNSSESCQNPETIKLNNTDVRTVSPLLNQKRSSSSGLSYLHKRKISDQIPTSATLGYQDAHLQPSLLTSSKAASFEPDLATNSSKKLNQSPFRCVTVGSSHVNGSISAEPSLSNVCHDVKPNISTPLSFKRRFPNGGLQLPGTKNSDNVASPGTLAAEFDVGSDPGDHQYSAVGSTSKAQSSRNLIFDNEMINEPEIKPKLATSIITKEGREVEVDYPKCLVGSKPDNMEISLSKVPSGLTSNIVENRNNLKENESNGNPKALDFDGSRELVSGNPKVLEAKDNTPPDVASKSLVKKKLHHEKLIDAGTNDDDVAVKEKLHEEMMVGSATNCGNVVDEKRAVLKPEKKKKGGKRVVSRAKKSVKAEACSEEVVTDENMKDETPITLDPDANVVPDAKGSNVSEGDIMDLSTCETLKSAEVESLCTAQIDNTIAPAKDEVVKEVDAAENTSAVAEDQVVKEKQGVLKARKIKGGKRYVTSNKKSVVAECSRGNVKENVDILDAELLNSHENQMPVSEGSKANDEIDTGAAAGDEGDASLDNKSVGEPEKKKVKGAKNKANLSKKSDGARMDSSSKKVATKDKYTKDAPSTSSVKTTPKKVGHEDVQKPVIMENPRDVEMVDATTGGEGDASHDNKSEVEPEKKKVKGVKKKATRAEKSAGEMDFSSKKVATDDKHKKDAPSTSSVKATPNKVGKEDDDLSKDSEKENRPLDTAAAARHSNKGKIGTIGKKILSVAKKCVEKNREMEVERVLKIIKSEPAVFILSGHRCERKEFQKIIRQLKGRVCRDSHQWSYQATHFIAPEPLRRTEKLFAAAAAGRWILRMDYLTASNEAGKLLDEKPYEWHKNGLSEDGAISLEAPRKWRLLRERTGHGAFYGFRVIVYGECIAPSLDTLKRVIKAGDGTIVATSPPYSRFLDSGVDFAVISPGMPRVDAWVQEFLRHEIPCVLADYLVEYVCKPGYPLDRHVLFNTLEWANKSLAHLARRSEEVVPVLPSEDEEEDDVSCVVCGSRDRADVMLICGSEDGSSGCGVGTHIDCCEPPLESVPEEDWYCPKCSEDRADVSTTKKKGKATRKRWL